MLHELSITAKLVEISLRRRQIVQVEHTLQLHADNDGKDGQENLDEISEDGAPDVTLSDHLPVLDLQEDHEKGVDAADEANYGEGCDEVRSINHFFVGTAPCSVDLEG